MKKHIFRAVCIAVLMPVLCLACSPKSSDQEKEGTMTDHTDQAEEGMSGPERDPDQNLYRNISAEEAKAMMEDSDTYLLLDVRTEEEYLSERIDGAVLIPDTEIKERAQTEIPDQTMLILVYCRSGHRSENAARELAAMGYTNVYDLGGIVDWPYDTVSGQ